MGLAGLQKEVLAGGPPEICVGRLGCGNALVSLSLALFDRTAGTAILSTIRLLDGEVHVAESFGAQSLPGTLRRLEDFSAASGVPNGDLHHGTVVHRIARGLVVGQVLPTPISF